MDERWKRVIAAPLAFVIALLSALTILGAFAPKAYAATSEPTGLQAYIRFPMGQMKLDSTQSNQAPWK